MRIENRTWLQMNDKDVIVIINLVIVPHPTCFQPNTQLVWCPKWMKNLFEFYGAFVDWYKDSLYFDSKSQASHKEDYDPWASKYFHC